MSNSNGPIPGIRQPLYLSGADLARELGMTEVGLGEIRRALDLDSCTGSGGRARVCRYTEPDIRRVMAFHALMTELGMSPRATARVQAAIAARRARNGAGRDEAG